MLRECYVAIAARRSREVIREFKLLIAANSSRGKSDHLRRQTTHTYQPLAPREFRFVNDPSRPGNTAGTLSGVTRNGRNHEEVEERERGESGEGPVDSNLRKVWRRDGRNPNSRAVSVLEGVAISIFHRPYRTRWLSDSKVTSSTLEVMVDTAEEMIFDRDGVDNG